MKLHFLGGSVERVHSMKKLPPHIAKPEVEERW